MYQSFVHVVMYTWQVSENGLPKSWPLQVVKASDQGNLIVCHDNVAKLMKMHDDDSIARVVTFVGPPRIGKSTTASLLAAFLDQDIAMAMYKTDCAMSFQVSDDCEAMTKGIYAWPVKMENGDVAIIFDVEGLDSPDQVKINEEVLHATVL